MTMFAVDCSFEWNKREQNNADIFIEKRAGDKGKLLP
jgi:hypothetical protein